MPTTLRSGEQVTVLMELGFPVNKFTLDSTTLGILDTNYLEGTLLGDDVSPYVQSLSISRGRSSQLDQFSAGICNVVLNNNDRRFDPVNTSSPYWDPTDNRTGVVPRRKVTVSLNGIAVFTGKIADIDVMYDFNNLSTATIAAVDDFVLLANAFTSTAFTPTEQLSGSRVTAILDRSEIAYPSTRAISAGTATLGAYQVDANTNALSYLQDCAAAEYGLLFVSGDGNLTFTNRIDYVFAPTSPVTFSDNGSGIPYTALSVAYGQEFLYNRIQMTRFGGTQQAANDTSSQTEYGISTYALDNMLFSTDAQVLTLANTYLTQYSQPVYRFDNISVNLTGLSNANRTVVNDIEIGDVIQITRTYSTGTPTSTTQAYAIEGIRHSLTAGNHVVEFTLRFAPIVYQLLLNNATYGVLDAKNALT